MGKIKIKKIAPSLPAATGIKPPPLDALPGTIPSESHAKEAAKANGVHGDAPAATAMKATKVMLKIKK
jgi:hypothetical protein